MVRTTCIDLRISRWPWLERLIAGRWVPRVLKRVGLGLVFTRAAKSGRQAGERG